MGHAVHQPSIPRAVLAGAGLLLASAIAFTVFSQLTGVGKTELGSPEAVASRTLQFAEQQGGSIVIRDVEAGREVVTIASGKGNFIRVALRSMGYERRLKSIGPETPFTLSRWADGRLLLADPGTGRRIELVAFGASNANEFARLLELGSQ